MNREALRQQRLVAALWRDAAVPESPVLIRAADPFDTSGPHIRREAYQGQGDCRDWDPEW
jgi:hypothetical protein